MSDKNPLFYQLRNVLKSQSSDPLLESILEELQTLRERSKDVFLQYEGSDKSKPPGRGIYQDLFYEIFIDCWTTLAKLDEFKNKFSLPTLYISDPFSIHLRKCSDTLFSLEAGCRRAGDNPIFCGCKGVGKTTLLDAVGKISSVLLDSVIPIYWSYEFSGLPSIAQLLSDVAMSLGSSATASASAAVTKTEKVQLEIEKFIMSHGTPIFLLDEFTCLYLEENRSIGINIMKEILFVGKTVNSSTIFLGASATCVENFIHGFSGFPNLNNSVFHMRSIHPIRDLESLQKYSKMRYPDWEADTSIIFDKTGGVGRLIADFRNCPNSYQSPSIIDKVCSSCKLYAVCTAILSSINRGRYPNYGPWPVLGISSDTVRDILTKEFGLDEGKAVARIKSWSDSLVFFNRNGVTEFLVPEQARNLLAHIYSNDILRKTFVLSITLRGFDGGTPGHANEAFICDNIKDEIGVSDAGSLHLSGKNARLVVDGLESKPDDIHQLCDMLITWVGETGIDRFWLTTDSDDGVFTVNALQIKTGKMKLSIASGTCRREQDSSNNANDTTVAGILQKCELGYKKLTIKLKTYFPSAKFKLGSLSVYCTKNVNKGVSDFQTKYPNWRCTYDLRDSVIKELRESDAIDINSPTAFEWFVYGVEDGWMARVLPSAVTTRL